MQSTGFSHLEGEYRMSTDVNSHSNYNGMELRKLKIRVGRENATQLQFSSFLLLYLVTEGALWPLSELTPTSMSDSPSLRDEELRAVCQEMDRILVLFMERLEQYQAHHTRAVNHIKSVRGEQSPIPLFRIAYDSLIGHKTRNKF